MPKIVWDRLLSRGTGGIVLALWLVLATAACEMASTTAAGLNPAILRTTRGGPVRANSPPGVEVTLGGSRVLPTGEMRAD